MYPIPIPGRSTGVTKDNSRHETKLGENTEASKRSTDTVSKSNKSNSTRKRAPRQDHLNALLRLQVKYQSLETRLHANNFLVSILENNLRQLESSLNTAEKAIQNFATCLPNILMAKSLEEALYDADQKIKGLAYHVSQIPSVEGEKKIEDCDVSILNQKRCESRPAVTESSNVNLEPFDEQYGFA